MCKGGYEKDTDSPYRSSYKPVCHTVTCHMDVARAQWAIGLVQIASDLSCEALSTGPRLALAGRYARVGERAGKVVG